MQIDQTTLDLARMAVVYVHLIACCLAIGLVLRSDVVMLRELFTRGQGHARDLAGLQTVVSWALRVLWVTGVVLVTYEALKPDGIGWYSLMNPKIQAKILVVTLLTLNGFVLHSLVLPALQRAGSLLHMSFGQSTLGCFAGAVSGVSWMYAALLGVGRPLSWKFTLGEIMAAYPVMVIGGFVTMLALVTYLRPPKHQPENTTWTA